MRDANPPAPWVLGLGPLLLLLATILIAATLALTSIFSYIRLQTNVASIGSLAHCLPRAARGPSRRMVFVVCLATTLSGIFSTTTPVRHSTVFDPELEHIGQLASRCFTELTPAWLMFYVFLRYLVLISLRFV